MRLLVATDFNPDSPGGGPSVVRQMLAGFPGDVHWWSCRPAVGGTAGKRAGFEVSSLRCCPPGKLMPARLLTRIKAFLMERLWSPRAAASLVGSIRLTKPDCVWAIPHDWSILPLSRALLGESPGSTPCCLHVTIQDYPDIHGHSEAWGASRTKHLAKQQDELYARATSRDATSWPMLEDLQRRTGAAGVQMLHQGLEDEDFEFLSQPPDNRPAGAPVRIAYAGTVLAHDALERFVRLMEPIRSRGLTARLEFWGAHSNADRPWFRPEWMVEHGNLPEEQLLQELRACDWGLSPMALSDDDPRYNRYSFPTKFITYLAAGLPVLTMGHRASSVMRTAADHPVGILLGDNADGAAESLQTALADRGSKAAHRGEILACAHALFDASRMRDKLWELLVGGLAGGVR